ncbi:hypothetical protein SAMN05421805_112199, partial [Saccharopolyspora antimicrobica]
PGSTWRRGSAADCAGCPAETGASPSARSWRGCPPRSERSESWPVTAAATSHRSRLGSCRMRRRRITHSRSSHRRGFSAFAWRGQPERRVSDIHKSGIPESRRTLRFRHPHRCARRAWKKSEKDEVRTFGPSPRWPKARTHPHRPSGRRPECFRPPSGRPDRPRRNDRGGRATIPPWTPPRAALSANPARLDPHWRQIPSGDYTPAKRSLNADPPVPGRAAATDIAAGRGRMFKRSRPTRPAVP